MTQHSERDVINSACVLDLSGVFHSAAKLNSPARLPWLKMSDTSERKSAWMNEWRGAEGSLPLKPTAILLIPNPPPLRSFRRHSSGLSIATSHPALLISLKTGSVTWEGLWAGSGSQKAHCSPSFCLYQKQPSPWQPIQRPTCLRDAAFVVQVICVVSRPLEW